MAKAIKYRFKNKTIIGGKELKCSQADVFIIC